DAPAYRSGVLCLDGVEVSTMGGHYIALDMPPAPYPLGGEARDVVDDVRRLGGFGIVAHPDSPKPELQWREWDAPFDAMEMVNPDTGWRVQAVRLRPERPLSADPALDAAAVMRTIRAGHLHATIDGIATPGLLEFTAEHSAGSAQEGDELHARGPVVLHVRTNAPRSFTTS